MSLLKKALLLVGDIATYYIGLAAMLLLRYGTSDFALRFEAHFVAFSAILPLWIAAFYIVDLYRQTAFRKPSLLLRSASIAIIASSLLSIIVFYLFGDFFRLTPKTNLLVFAAVFLLLEYTWRIFAARVFIARAQEILIIGDSPLITETIEHVSSNPHLGYKIAGHFKHIDGQGAFDELTRLIKEKRIGTIVIQPHLAKGSSSLHSIYQLLPFRINIINFWDLYETIFEKIPLEELEEGWFIENITARRPFYDISKRILDFAIAGTVSLLLLPIALLIAALIKLTSPGPIIYTQKRYGKDGASFTLYKFRTMHHNAGGPLWTEAEDKRVTGVGKLLRRTHLDEIPQLLNIIKGDISITGPRPERTELAEQFKKFPYYEIRHIIKPGLTGWAQISYKPSASLEEAYEKLRYDIYYVKNRSFFLDILIILKTIKYLFTSSQ